jgi:hypothetical protein
MALTILPSDTHTFSAAGGTWQIEVYHQGQAPEVTPSDTWMTITWRSFSDNGSYYEIQVPAYSGSSDRTGTIDFEHFQGDSATVTITQQGAAQGTIYTNPSVLVWDNAGGSRTFLVAGTAALSGQSLNNGMYTVASWIPSISYSGAGGGGYFYTVTAASHQPDPPADIYREDTVDIDGDGGVTTVLDIVQGEIITAENQMDINGLGTYTGAAFGVYFKDTISVSKDSGDDWYNVSVRTSQPGYNIYNVSASQNNTGQTRTGTATFTDKYSSVSIPVVQTPLGTVSFNKSALTYTSSGGTENVNITYTQTGASYWVSDNWMTLSEVSSDPVNKTITVAATATSNLGQTRTTTLWAQATDGVTSVSIPVVQRGEAEVQTTVDPSSLVFGPAGSTLSTAVSFSGALTYSIPQGEDWVSVSTVPVTAREKTAYVTVSTNPSANSRHLNVTFTGSSSGDATLAVTQTGEAEISVAPSSLTFGSTSSSANVSVTNFVGTITTSKSGSWITIGTPLGVDVRYFPISVASNSGAARNGWVSFTDSRDITKGVYVEQAGKFEITPSTVTLNWGYDYEELSDDSNTTFHITGLTSSMSTPRRVITYGGEAGAPADWLAFDGVISSSDAYERAYLSSKYDRVSSGTWTATVDWYSGNTYLGQTTVVRDGTIPPSTVTPSSRTYTSRGGSESFQVFTAYPPVSASTSDSWITVTSGTTNTPFFNFNVTTASNSGQERRGTVTFTGYQNVSIGSVEIIQKGTAAPTMTFLPSSLFYSGSGGTENVRVTWTSGTTPVTSISYPSSGPSDWITAHYAGAGGADWFDTEYTAGANTTTASRTAQILYNNGVETIAVPVTQYRGSAPAPVLSVSPDDFDFGYQGGRHSDLLTISYNQTNYTVSFPDKPDWVSFLVKQYTETGVEYYVNASSNDSTTARSATITAVGSIGGSDTFTVDQSGAPYPSLSVNTNNLSFTSASGHQSVTVTNISGSLSYTPSVNWVTVSESGSGGSRSLSVRVTENDTAVSRSGSLAIDDDRQSPVSVAITQEAGQAPIDTISFSPSSMTFNAVDTTQKILTVTHPYGWLNFDKNYQQDSGWLTVTLREFIDDNTTSYNVYITDGYDNTGNSRQCYLDFTSYSGATGRVVVTQQAGAAPPPASGDYIPVWRDFLYSPSGFRNGQDYAYSLRGSGGTVLYQGVTVAPDSSHKPDPINITRLVESYVNSGEFNYTSGSWKKLPGELTVNFYKVGQSGLIQQWLIWNDWSRYKLVYDSISTLNDPINFRACQGMKLPLCVYQKGTTVWSITETKKNGRISTTSINYPSSYKFAVYVPSYTSNAKKLSFNRGSSTQFSYDMTACGQGYFLYRNRFGGWDSFLIEGNIYKKEGYARQNYTSPVNTSYGYSVDRHTDKVNITTSYEVHTGWLTDQEAERLVYHLLSSPKVYFTSFEGDHYELGDMKEVILTGSQAEYKKYRNGRKLTSYTITFDASDTKRVQR